MPKFGEQLDAAITYNITVSKVLGAVLSTPAHLMFVPQLL